MKKILIIPMTIILTLVSCNQQEIEFALDAISDQQALASCEIVSYSQPTSPLYSNVVNSYDPITEISRSYADIDNAIAISARSGRCVMNMFTMSSPLARIAPRYTVYYYSNSFISSDSCQLNDGQVVEFNFSNPRSPVCTVTISAPIRL